MKIGIIGTGRLGICKALCLYNAGYDVYCYDNNKEYLDKIKNKVFKSLEPSVNELLLTAAINFSDNISDIITNCDVIFILIQTPSLKDGSYNHTYIDSFINELIVLGKQDIKKILVISSTVMPEYTNNILKKIEKYNYDVCYNPSFIAQGTIIKNLKNPNLILIGENRHESGKIIEEIHKKIIENGDEATICRMSTLEAEITKISINCFITTKISFANMIGDLVKSKGYNPDVVLNAIGIDKRIGNRYLKYGYGFGGPCFPRDNRALNYYANANDFNFELCDTTDNLNHQHLLYQYNELKDSKEPIEFIYITYKDESDILEESQKLKLAIKLADNGCQVIIKERDYVIEKLKESYDNLFTYICIQ